MAVSIHAPRAGGDSGYRNLRYQIRGFQSTPPARGATHGDKAPQYHRTGFNPRPPRGGRLETVDALERFEQVSIHAPRAGGDPPSRSLLPGRKRFNPRPPRGGRLSCADGQRQLILFQSTPPARGATFGPFGRNP